MVFQVKGVGRGQTVSLLQQFVELLTYLLWGKATADNLSAAQNDVVGNGGQAELTHQTAVKHLAIAHRGPVDGVAPLRVTTLSYRSVDIDTQQPQPTRSLAASLLQLPLNIHALVIPRGPNVDNGQLGSPKIGGRNGPSVHVGGVKVLQFALHRDVLHLTGTRQKTIQITVLGLFLA